MRSLALMFMAWLSLSPASALACGTCASGDPTLTVLGTGKPFPGRLRLAAEARLRTDAIGRAGVDRVELREESLSFGAAWSMTPSTTWALRIPVVRRTVENVAGAVDRVIGLTDSEVRLRHTLFALQPAAARHVLRLSAGSGIPTGSVLRDSDGALLPVHAQPGTGAFVPMVGLSWGGLLPPWSSWVSLSTWWPLQGERGLQAGRSLRASVAGQWQPSATWAFRMGADGRWDEASKDHGAVDPNSGGAILFASPEILWSPSTDVLLSMALRWPVLNALTGGHEEGPVPSLSLTWDV